jgi:histidinol dehydrogenase
VGWVELDQAAAAALAPAVAAIARDEGLHAHARSAELRGGP